MNSRFLERAPLLGAMIGAAILFASGTSRAVECAYSLPPVPEAGATGVPTNTLLWSYSGEFEPAIVRLLGPEGEVPLEERWLPVAGHGRRSVLQPLEELAPESRYTVELTWLDSDGEPYVLPDGTLDTRLTHFTTGAGPALSPPPIPRLLSNEPIIGNGWLGVERSVRLTFEEHAGILIGDADGAAGTVSELEALLVPLPENDAAPTDRIAALEARVAELEAQLGGASAYESGGVAWITPGYSLSTGFGACLEWPGGDRVVGRFALLDLAGNFSGWLEGVDITLPSNEEVRAFVAANPVSEPYGYPTSPSSSQSARGCQLGATRARAGSGFVGIAMLFLSAALRARARRNPASAVSLVRRGTTPRAQQRFGAIDMIFMVVGRTIAERAPAESFAQSRGIPAWNDSDPECHLLPLLLGNGDRTNPGRRLHPGVDFISVSQYSDAGSFDAGSTRARAGRHDKGLG